MSADGPSVDCLPIFLNQQTVEPSRTSPADQQATPRIERGRHTPRQGRSFKRYWAFERTAIAARTVRARGICSERGLYLRRDTAQRSDHLAVRNIRHFLQLRDHEDFRADAGNVL